MNIAGFWIRVLASIIDLIIFLCLLFIVGYIYLYIASDGFQKFVEFSGPESLLLNYLIQFVISCLWFIPFWVWVGANPGKMICGLKIVNMDESDIGFVTAFLRVIGYFISGLVLGIGYLWVAFDKNKQGWHDKIAGTYVIKVKEY